MALLPVKRREGTESGLARLHDEMDDLFRGFFRDWGTPTAFRGRWPAIDIAEDDNAYTVKAEVPGCKAEDIDISVNANVLTISGEKRQAEETKQKGYYHMERSWGSFRRDLTLAGDVETGKIEASCKDGVLTVTLPKSEKAKPAKIKIKGS